MLINFFKKITNIRKYINHNKNIFNQSKINTKDFILVDQFNFYPSLIPLSHFIERLQNKFNSNIYIYEINMDKGFLRKVKNFLKDIYKYVYIYIYKFFVYRYML